MFNLSSLIVSKVFIVSLNTTALVPLPFLFTYREVDFIFVTIICMTKKKLPISFKRMTEYAFPTNAFLRQKVELHFAYDDRNVLRSLSMIYN
jgi:hypothetical protein